MSFTISKQNLHIRHVYILCYAKFMYYKVYSQNVGYDANRPAVHCFTVGFLSQHFRGWKNKTKQQKCLGKIDV